MQGKLIVVTGPMYAGKTGWLIDRSRGRSFRAFVPEIAVRGLRSRDGREIPAERLPLSVGPGFPLGNADLYVFDEVQFFGQGFVELVGGLLAAGKEVMAAGLDLDWQKRPFETTARLLCLADEVVKLTARCSICGAPARFSWKISADGRRIDPAARYEPRCVLHHPLR